MSKVLLVEDEPNLLWTMSELLKRAGYEVLKATDFDSAILILESCDLDAAVLDIILPGKNGIELLKHIRSLNICVPVIMITGQPHISLLPEIVRADAYDFLPKPVSKNVLLRSVQRAIERKRLMEEKQSLELEVKQYAEHLESLVRERTRELAEAHNFLNTVLDSSTEYAIIAIDRNGLITLFNRGAEDLFGFTSQEMINKPARQLILDQKYMADERPFLKHGQEAEATGRHQVEIILGRADGTTFAASVTLTVIRKGDGELLGYLAIIRDLTAEQKNQEWMQQLQKRLSQQEKIAALGRMAAQVSHEIRNPLAGLRLYSLHLKDKVAARLKEGEVALIDKIIGGIDHLSDIVEQVLNFARPVTLARNSVDLNRLVWEAIQMLSPQLEANNIEVNLDLAEQPATSLLDEALIRSALLNLLVNSIQAMPTGGRLIVSGSSSNGAIHLTITDTGCGMTREEIKNVFEPFYTTKSRGLGLGMPFTEKIIKQHGGTLLLESETGKGTHIAITLPAEENYASKAAQQDSHCG